MHAGIAAALPAQSPFETWPTQVAFPGGRAWLTPKGEALVTQTTVEHADEALAIAMHGFILQLVTDGIGKRMPNPTIVHDWRSVRRVEQRAVGAWLARSKQTAPTFMGSKIYIACDASPLLRMVLRPALLSNQALTRIPAPDLVEDPAPVLARHAIGAPPPDFWAAWRDASR